MIRERLSATPLVMVIFLFGEVDAMLTTICTLVALDYLSGLMAGFITGELSSKVGFKGILKKIFIFIILATANRIDVVMNANGAIRFVVMSAMIGNEGLSILENAGRCGVPGTEFLSKKLAQLRDMGKDDNNTGKE